MNAGNTPILITGTARSGSSAIANVINYCGAFGGNMSNKKGLYENDMIKEAIVCHYFELFGYDPEGQFPLPGKNLFIPSDWRNKVFKVLKSEGYKKGIWMYKDFRSALIWKIWHYAFPEAKWIIVRRRTGDIIQSCIKTGYMKAFKDPENCKKVGAFSEEDGWLWWVHQYENKFIEMITAGLNCQIIWPERMVNGDFNQLFNMIDWLGLKGDSKKIINLVEPLLWGSRSKKEKRDGTSNS
jgi:hypothetical protein